MTAREQLIAYIATLATLAFVFGAALFAAGHEVTVNEAFGLGTITGGLIGVLRIPSARSPVATTDSGDVNVAGKDAQA
jgi:hypothetical protein